jgi:hypothetical protein
MVRFRDSIVSFRLSFVLGRLLIPLLVLPPHPVAEEKSADWESKERQSKVQSEMLPSAQHRHGE